MFTQPTTALYNRSENICLFRVFECVSDREIRQFRVPINQSGLTWLSAHGLINPLETSQHFPTESSLMVRLLF